MNASSPTHTTASSLQARKITRKELAVYCGLSVRMIDELTRSGVLGHFKIGKSIRYDLAEVEATLSERFHVGARGRAGAHADAVCREGGTETHDGGLRTSRPTSSHACARPARGGAGCPQPAAPKPGGIVERQILQENLLPAIHDTHTAAANAGTLCRDDHPETHDGGLRTSRTAFSTTTTQPAA